MIRHWIAEIDQINQSFTDTFGGLPPEVLNWSPHPSAWSIAQNIDHLIKVNKSYFPTFDALHKGQYSAPFTCHIPFLPRLMGRSILRSVQPQVKRKMITFPVWEPTQSKTDTDILQQFFRQQSGLQQHIRQSAGLLQVVISSPANKYIVYPLQTAIEIIITHEKRHFEQARSVLQLHP